MSDNTTEHDDFDADAAFNEAAAALSEAPATATTTDDDGDQNEQPEGHQQYSAAAEPAAAAPAESPEVAALKAELARLNHGWNSDRGRLSALTKKLEQLEAHKPEQSLPASAAGMDDMKNGRVLTSIP